MKPTRESLVRGSVYAGLGLIALLGLSRINFRAPTASAAQAPEKPQSWVKLGFNPSVSLDGATYRVSGPYKHENLAVYLLHSTDQDPTDYITLEEGLRSGIVKVTEKDQERVNELVIENTGVQPLFLQEGDRIQGGKQDRIIYASHVVPPKSGKMPVASFCVEQSRWTAGAGGKNFGGNANPVLAPVAVRSAAKVHNSQGQVWAAVASQKAVAQQRGLASNSNSSLNETLDAPKVKKLSDEFVAALKDVLDKQADAKGIAIAVNGQILEVNEYPNHQVLSKLYPRLLGSYALEAVLNKEEGKGNWTPQAAEVCAFMWENDQQAKQEVLAAAQPREARSALANNRALLQAVNFANDPSPNANMDQQEFAQQVLNGSPAPTRTQYLRNQQEGQQTQNNQRFGRATRYNPMSGSNVQQPGRQQVEESVERQAPAQAPAPQQVSVNKDNRLNIAQSQNAALCETRYHEKLVHRQILRRDTAQPARQPVNQINVPLPQREINQINVPNDPPPQRTNPVNPPAPAPKN